MNLLNFEKVYESFQSFAGGTVVREHAGAGIVDVAALPRFVRHPKVLDHFRLTGIVFLKNFTVEKGFFRKRRCERIFCGAELHFVIGVLCFGVGLEVIDHRVTDGIGERGCLAV